MHDVHAVGDAEALGVCARELDGSFVRIGRPDLDVRLVHCERDGDCAAAGADVRDPHRHAVDALQRGLDEALGRGPRREDTSRLGFEVEVVEGGFHKLRP